MSYSEIVAAYEADEIDFLLALELANCFSIIELYEMAASEEEAALQENSAQQGG